MANVPQLSFPVLEYNVSIEFLISFSKKKKKKKKKLNLMIKYTIIPKTGFGVEVKKSDTI